MARVRPCSSKQTGSENRVFSSAKQTLSSHGRLFQLGAMQVLSRHSVHGLIGSAWLSTPIDSHDDGTRRDNYCDVQWRKAEMKRVVDLRAIRNESSRVIFVG